MDTEFNLNYRENKFMSNFNNRSWNFLGISDPYQNLAIEPLSPNTLNRFFIAPRPFL